MGLQDVLRDEVLDRVPARLEQGVVGVARTGGKEEVAPLLGNMPPSRRDWVAGKIVEQARAWSVTQLEEATLGLRRADRLLKSSSLAEDLVLEEWLLGLMAQEGGGQGPPDGTDRP